MSHKVFGRNPSGKHRQMIRQSPHYKDQAFNNLEKTPVMAEDGSFWKTMRDYFHQPSSREPKIALPTVKTDLPGLNPTDTALVWFGHSSYFLKAGGYNILVDPVFSNNASPVSFMVKGFRGTSLFKAEDMPAIDLLLLTHDHYDHLDYASILKLKSKTKLICTALGVGSHLQYWGVKPAIIQEFDWWESRTVLPGLNLTAAPARHFSGRGLRRGKTLWLSFILETKQHRLYLGGDSGYGRHFREIGRRFGPFELAVLEAGQYNKNWPHIHMMPEETVQACLDVGSRNLLPVHWGRFTLAMHPWDEPIRRVVAKAGELKVNVTTPLIGEPVRIGRHYPASSWWENLITSA